MKVSEDNYVMLMQQGNEAALRYFIEHYGWIVKSMVQKSMAAFASEQEDCINETFLAIWQNAGKYDRRKAAFTTWAAAVTRYKILNYMRNIRKRAVEESIDGMEFEEKQEIDSGLLKEVEEQEFQELLMILPERDREIFTQLFWEELSYDEVSDNCNIKKDVLYNRISRGKRKLRQALGKKVREEML